MDAISRSLILTLALVVMPMIPMATNAASSSTQSPGGGANHSSYKSNGEDFLVAQIAPAASNTLNNLNTFVIPNTEPTNSLGSFGSAYNLAITSVRWQAQSIWTTRTLDPATLELITNVHYNFLINPMLAARQPNQPDLQLPDGQYLLRIALVLATPASQKFSQFNQLHRKLRLTERLVSWTQQVVEVRGGTITAEVALPFRNITATTLMNDLLLELSPLKVGGIDYERNGRIELLPVRPTILKGPFFAGREGHILSNKQNFELQAVPKKPTTLSRYIAEAEAQRAYALSQRPQYKNTQVAAEAFATGNHLKFLTNNSPEFRAVLPEALGMKRSQQDILSLLETKNGDVLEMEKKRGAAASLCRLMANRLARELILLPLYECHRHPERYLRIAKNVHVAAVGNQEPILKRHQLRFSVSGNYMVSRSRSQDVFSSVSVSGGPNLGLKISDALGLSASASYNYTINESNSRSQAENMILSNSLQINVNTVTAHIPLKRFRTCISVTPAPFANNPFLHKESPHLGFYICNSQEEKDSVVVEEYAHLHENLNEGASIDALSAAAQGVNFSTRGDRDLIAFFYSVRMAQTANQSTANATDTAITNAMTYLESAQSGFPGIIAVPVEMRKINYSAPTFWQKVMGEYQENFLSVAN